MATSPHERMRAAAAASKRAADLVPPSDTPTASPEPRLPRQDSPRSDPPPPPEAGSPPQTQPMTDPATLIAEGQALVRSLAMQVFRSLPFRMELDDLVAYGQLGLAEAAQSYRPDGGTRFTTFAYYRIRGAIYDGVSKMNWTSRARYRRMRFQQLAGEVLEDENERSGDGSRPGESDAGWLGRVTERLAVVYLATGGDEGETDRLSQAADPQDAPSKVVADRELQQRLRVMVDDLTPDAKRLINTIYFQGLTLSEAAKLLGVSKSWASRLHARSLEQLARSLRRCGAE